MFKSVAAFLLTLMMIAPVTALAAPEELKMGVGDYWEYGFVGNLYDESGAGTVKMEIVKVEQQTVMGQTQDAFKLAYTSTISFSGGGNTVSVGAETTGAIHRLASNFSMISQVMSMEANWLASGVALTERRGMTASYCPVLDDYVGDMKLYVGASYTTRCTMSVHSWTEYLGTNETDFDNGTVDLTVRVVAENVTVDTPAGKFKCYKIAVAGETLHDFDYNVYYYYSEKVGNYVKWEGDEAPITGFIMHPDMQSTVTLQSYSYSGEAKSLFAGPMIWIVLAVVAAVVIIVVLELMRRKGGPTVATVPKEELTQEAP